jgi:hypothetical protein
MSSSILRFLSALALATSAVFATTSVANAEGIGHLSASKVGDQTGVEVALGYRASYQGLFITPAVGALIYQGDNTRYTFERESNGTQVCRDHSNGQFAKKSLCDSTAIDAYASLEAGYMFNRGAALGVGVRFGDTTTPYTALTFGTGGPVNFRLAAGKQYVSFGMVAAF